MLAADAQTPALAGPALRCFGSDLLNLSAPRYRKRRRLIAANFSCVEYCVCSHMRGDGRQHLLFSIHKTAGIEAGDFEPVPVCDGVGRAGLDAVAAKNAAVVIDVIDPGVALG